jgi:hypothetical protein
MNVCIQGLGWVTPLGRDLSAVWQAVRNGTVPQPSLLENPFNGRTFPVRRIDPATLTDVARLPRLRRSSVISHFAVAAAQDALRDAGCDPLTERLAVVFAATNGGVIYTRRFFEEVSKSGTQAGSPLLFPETVYNAPASHIAATAGVTGTVTTIVNDATAGIDALAAACDLLESGTFDRCLLVAAEESDWAICEAYAAWKLDAVASPSGLPPSGLGAVFAEGAAALLLGGGGGGPAIDRIFNGATFRSIGEARRSIADFAAQAGAGMTISSVSGTRFDEAEADLAGPRLAPKISLGEAFAASTVMQIACAALALREKPENDRMFVPAVGFHGQVAAVSLRA